MKSLKAQTQFSGIPRRRSTTSSHGSRVCSPCSLSPLAQALRQKMPHLALALALAHVRAEVRDTQPGPALAIPSPEPHQRGRNWLSANFRHRPVST